MIVFSYSLTLEVVDADKYAPNLFTACQYIQTMLVHIFVQSIECLQFEIKGIEPSMPLLRYKLQGYILGVVPFHCMRAWLPKINFRQNLLTSFIKCRGTPRWGRMRQIIILEQPFPAQNPLHFTLNISMLLSTKIYLILQDPRCRCITFLFHCYLIQTISSITCW